MCVCLKRKRVSCENGRNNVLLLSRMVYCLDSCPTSSTRSLHVYRSTVFASQSHICLLSETLASCISSVLFPALHSVWTTAQQTASKVVIYFCLTHSLEERKHSDTGLLMFMLSTCQSRGELSGSGSVNWALIRCCSN